MSTYTCIHRLLLLRYKLCFTNFRVKALPLVCHRWHKTLTDPSMWPTIDVAPFDGYTAARGTEQNSWLRKRAPGMRELTLRVNAWHC